ncbi:putative leucine-rich repeat receptor-like protein kinase At2g19210 [Nymphaea colorata]|nr:putative leucine-rich repeat receptor-like protein kinase At2g19210 [Nymphaea colorata]
MMDVHGFFFLLCCAAVLLLGGAQTGFISIDCGLSETHSYINSYDNLTYVSDDGFIDSGVNGRIDPTTSIGKGSNEAYYTVRSFPNYKRNCYQLPATVGTKYILRAAFLYGNYDRLNTIPSFDLYFGADFWDTVNLTSNDQSFRPELVVQAESNYLFVCLVNTGRGIPFISGLKLRPLNPDMYAPANSSLSLALKTVKRVDVGANNYTVYPDDRFDRIWEPNYNSYGTPYSTNETVSESGDPMFGMPSVVMQTAVYSKDKILVNWPGGVDDSFYLYLEFADIVRPVGRQPRQMQVQMNGQDWGDPVDVHPFRSNVSYSTSPETASQYSFSIRSVNTSDEGAVLNSFEVYKALTVARSATDAREVNALQAIKEFYNLKKNWRGDPCLPVPPWDGLTCDNASTPRILTLDLSNSELNGTIAQQISELTALKTLNLSRNNLKGEVPEFLQDLQNLNNIDLSTNDLSGSIPPGLRQKNKTGVIILSIDGNPQICEENQCDQDEKGRKLHLIVIPAVVSLVVATAILLLVVTVVIKQRKQGKGRRPKDNKEMVDSLPGQHAGLGSGKSGTFTYSQVVEMTNNFEKVIGRGGFGTVFYGRLKDGSEVAVKKLSSRLVERGTKEFAAEVKMLMQVHYKYLTQFVGYCDDEKELILIYEYMSNGNLQKLISEETAAALNWQQRLNIALDAAKGLEYLHSGCTPAFIHRDVKSSNILVNEKFEAKVADFGLSKAVVSDEVTHITTAVAGTAGYLDPEYCYTNQVTEKSDVYGFGVVLFELITGRSAISTNCNGERVPLVKLVRPELMRKDIKVIIDPRLQGQCDINSIRMVAETAMTCTEEKSVIRPTMTEVVAHLKEAMEIERSRKTSGSGKKWAFSAYSSSFGKTSSSATRTSNADSNIYPSASKLLQ